MNQRNNPFRVLADQAMRGDSAARTQLHQQLEPQLVHLVRQTLKHGERTSLDRHIFAAARRMGLENPSLSQHDPDEFIRKVAHCVCSQVIAKIRSKQDSVCLTTDTVADFTDPAVRMTA